MKNMIKFGCVADDFTGASDAASFLVKGGLNACLFNGVPDDNIDFDCDAIVIALKTRTQETTSAISDTEAAVEWLKNQGAQQLFFKYCSTFDSTKDGNIGPILDKILEKYNEKYTILCPALPVNGRTVKDGNLYVYDIPLHESHMKNHPLTPMWDSSIANLMKPQSKYECFNLTIDMMQLTDHEIFKMIHEFGENKEHFYVITDYVNDADAERIMELFGTLPILTGGSGLMEKIGNQLSDHTQPVKQVRTNTKGKGLLLAGSCSKATLEQITYFKNRNGKSVKIDPLKLMNGEQTIEDLWNICLDNPDEALLIYSSDETDRVKEIQKTGKENVAHLLESTMAELAKRAVEEEYTRIIVAGGETSGAVTKGLGFEQYKIGDSVVPGVPVMIPLNRNEVRLVLKSGNFGQEDFFIRALQMTKE